MNTESYNKRLPLIEAWVERNQAEPLSGVITASMALVTEQTTEEELTKIYESMRALLGTMDDNPLKKGKMPSLPAEVIISAESVKNQVVAVYAAIGDFDLIQQVFPRSTKLGQYPTVEAYAEHMGQKAYNNIVKAFREERWNGEYTEDDGLTITPAEPQEDSN